MRLVTGEDASEHIADASNLISGALNHRKRAKLQPKGIRSVGVGLS